MKNQERYFGEFRKMKDGSIKLFRVKQLIGVNQHKNFWKRVNSRNIARFVNKSKIIIK